MTDQLAEMLVSEPFRKECGHALGDALVRAHFTGTRTLGRTLTVLNSRLLSDLEPELKGQLPEVEQRNRLAVLLGEVAAGYAQALVDRTLDEQERIRHAAITAQSDAERKLRATDARFRAVFATAGTGIAIASVNGEILDVNKALAAMMGYRPREMCGRSVSQFVHPADRAEIWPAYQEMIAGEREQYRAEKRCYRKDGSELWGDMSMSLIRDERGEPCYTVAMLHDITDRKHLNERLRHQALHDPLTQLPNRIQFMDRLREQFDGAQPGDRVGLCYLDLDGFKAVNDSIGHDVGDELLIRLANRLHERLAAAGHLVARIGGDEFVILVDDCRDSAGAIQVAEVLMAAVREPVEINGHQLRITASIGVVERELAGTSSAELMKAADITLCRAKTCGKDRWALFDPDRNEREITRHTLAATMPTALARDEFMIEYQPIVALDSGRPIGAEALVRWNHPMYGQLRPEQFMGLAEETGLIDKLGCWMLRQACEQAAAWTGAHSHILPLVSVNVATRQLSDSRLSEHLRGALEASGLSPQQLQLELTESTAMSFAESLLVENLRAVADVGVRLVIDDFGIGHSNLACLRHLPVRGLKIAGAFLEGLNTPDDNPVDEDLVATMINLADRLDLSVTAEGVKTESQATRLRAMGCLAGQGDFFAPAGTAEDVIRMLAHG